MKLNNGAEVHAWHRYPNTVTKARVLAHWGDEWVIWITDYKPATDTPYGEAEAGRYFRDAEVARRKYFALLVEDSNVFGAKD